LVETRTIPSISSEEVAEAKEFFPMEKFFILGHARSGTTLLVRLVRLHPEIHCNYQAHFFTHPPLLSEMAAEKRFGDWLSRRSNRWNRGVDLTPVALRAMADFILERDARKVGKTFVGDKSPNVTLKEQAVKEMHIIYPDAHLINIVRDGRDTLISQRFQAFIDGSPEYLTAQDRKIIQAFGRDSAPFYNGERSVFTETAIRRMAQDWAQNVIETHRLGRELYGDQYHVLKYEDLLARPFETIAAVWQFLGVNADGLEDTVAEEMDQNPDADWQRNKAGDLVASLEKGKRGSWEELFTARDKRIFKEIAGEALIAWGYEKELDW
jgi:LPS sulfotransferase NodH